MKCFLIGKYRQEESYSNIFLQEPHWRGLYVLKVFKKIQSSEIVRLSIFYIGSE